LETKPGWVKPPKKAPVLFLAGDIGDPYSTKWRQFMEYCAQTWDAVFYVIGNHELYKNKLKDVQSHIESVFAELNSKVLHLLGRNKIVYYKDYKIVGCTLWSNIAHEAYLRMNDSVYIRDMTFDIYHAEFQHDSQWLKETLAERHDTIVMTHHCPSFKLMNPAYSKEGAINTAFYSELDELFQSHVKLWICGHTHTANDIQLGPTRCIINPIGYARENTAYRDEAFELM
jgi:predicted phosphohydrolase